MGRIYTASAKGRQFTTEISALVMRTQGRFMRLHEVGFAQDFSADVGEAEEENILIKFSSGYSSAGNATTISTSPRMLGDPASFVLCSSAGTTKASGGTPVQHNSWHWNIRIPFRHLWLPPARPIFPTSSIAMFEFATVPNDQIFFSVYAVYEEIGAIQ